VFEVTQRGDFEEAPEDAKRPRQFRDALASR
jgi:hypothetical protein